MHISRFLLNEVERDEDLLPFQTYYQEPSQNSIVETPREVGISYLPNAPKINQGQ